MFLLLEATIFLCNSLNVSVMPTQKSNSFLMNKFVVDIGLEFSSYVYEAEFVNLAQDNVVKNFTDFGLEWEIQFSVTILNEISSEIHNIVYIPGKLSVE